MKLQKHVESLQKRIEFLEGKKPKQRIRRQSGRQSGRRSKPRNHGRYRKKRSRRKRKHESRTSDWRPVPPKNSHSISRPKTSELSVIEKQGCDQNLENVRKSSLQNVESPSLENSDYEQNSDFDSDDSRKDGQSEKCVQFEDEDHDSKEVENPDSRTQG